jgi:hypothetical protein
MHNNAEISRAISGMQEDTYKIHVEILGLIATLSDNSSSEALTLSARYNLPSHCYIQTTFYL